LIRGRIESARISQKRNPSMRAKSLMVLLLFVPVAPTFAASDTGAVSSDCNSGFLARLAAAYREDASAEPDANAPAPARRGQDSPFSSPPFPSS